MHKDTIESVVFNAMVAKIKTLKVEQSQPNLHQADINALKVIITAKESEIDKILKNFATASQTVIERMNKTVDKLAEEISALNNQICKLETSKINRNQLDPDAIETIFANWDKVSKEDRQKLVDILITKVFVSKENIEIIWKL